MNKTGIDYVRYTWNWMTGCTNGCDYCFARRQARRFPRIYPNGFAPTFRPTRLDEPLHVRQPGRVLTCSMGDFACGEYDWLVEALGVMAATPEHEYLLLTKRPDIAADWLMRDDLRKRVDDQMSRWRDAYLDRWPLPNVRVGTSVEDQPAVDRRLPELGRLVGWQTWVSVEPLLGPITFRPKANSLDEMIRLMKCGDASRPTMLRGISWAVIGAQTGPGAVHPRYEWITSLIEQCDAAGVPVWIKDNVGWPDKIRGLPNGQ